MAAADDALKDAGWDVETATEEDKNRAGIMMGAGIGGLQGIYENAILFNEFGMKKISPFFIPSVLINLISGNGSVVYQQIKFLNVEISSTDAANEYEAFAEGF